jgi:hypothetical protein
MNSSFLDYSISRVTPNCVVCYLTVDDSYESVIIRLSSSSIIPKSKNEEFISNPYSPRSGYIIDNRKPINERFKSPEIKKGFMNLPLSIKELNGNLVRIDGSFYVFYANECYYYVGLDGIVISKDKNLLVFNDRCLISQTESSLIFCFIDLGCTIDLDSFNQGIENDMIYVVDKNDIRNQLISSIRRNIQDYDTIPEILCSYGSILFYKNEKGNLKYI